MKTANQSFDISDMDMISINPGQKLQEILKEAFPFDAGESQSFVGRFDRALKAEGEFALYVYESSINHMVRRLITGAKFVRRQCKNEGREADEGYLVNQIRKFVNSNVVLPKNRTELVVIFLLASINLKRRETKGVAEHLRRNSGGRPIETCYICGKSLDFHSKDQHDSVEVEHIWPNTFGGQSREFNYKLACHACNQVKKDAIDAADFHYEHICVDANKEDNSFNNQMKREFKMALWAKCQYSCNKCKAPASEVGELCLCRKEPTDSWHFFNIDAYCQRHATE